MKTSEYLLSGSEEIDRRQLQARVWQNEAEACIHNPRSMIIIYTPTQVWGSKPGPTDPAGERTLFGNED